MDGSIDLWEITVRLSLAAVGGAMLGWERESRNKPAGLRTHMMASLGSALFMVVAVDFTNEYRGGEGDAGLDPLRVMQGVVGGIGFLGAGAIIQSRKGVRGLTTATSIWLSSAIGVTCGMGYYAVAAVAVGLGLAILLVVGSVEPRLFPAKKGGKGSRPSDDDALSEDDAVSRPGNDPDSGISPPGVH